MKTKPNRETFGFTLIELLVVIAIIGLLAALAIPAVSKALLKGQMLGTLNNMRQLHLATTQCDLDFLTSRNTNHAWPGPTTLTGHVPTYAAWYQKLTNGYLTDTDFHKMMAAPGVAALGAGVAPTGGATPNVALTLYQVGNAPDTFPFLVTRNWELDSTPSFRGPPTPPPYGINGFIIMRKGGDGTIFKGHFATNATLTIIATNNIATSPEAT